MRIIKSLAALTLASFIFAGCSSTMPSVPSKTEKKIESVNIVADSIKEFDLGNNTGINVPVKLGLIGRENRFNIKAITNADLIDSSSILDIIVRLSIVSPVDQITNAGSAGAAFSGSQGNTVSDGYVATFSINNAGSPLSLPASFTLSNLQPSTSYKVIAQAYSDFPGTINETSVDGTAGNATGGGTALSVEQIDIDAAGLISIASDGGTANTLDISVQLRAQTGASSDASVSVNNGNAPAAETIS